MKGRKGHAEFSSDGTPNLFLNRNEANAEVVVHEICHLLFEARGYPAFILDATDDVRASFPWPDIVDLLVRMQDDISHHVFFPTLRTAGFRPDQPWLSELQKLDATEWREKDPHYIAEMVFRTQMELGDQAAIATFEQELIRNRLTVPVDLGRQMAQSVGNLNRRTKEEILRAYLRSANLFLSGGIRIEFVAWHAVPYGKIVVNVAELRATR